MHAGVSDKIAASPKPTRNHQHIKNKGYICGRIS
jgi:hypothetical protein